jgi:nitrate/nitrite transporter NarK
VLIAATLSSTVAFMPPFLLGALAVPIRTELRFTEARLGLAVSVFFLTAALASVHAGRLPSAAVRDGPWPSARGRRPCC